SQLNHTSIGLTYNAGPIRTAPVDPRNDPTQPPDNPQGTLLFPTQVFRTDSDLFRPVGTVNNPTTDLETSFLAGQLGTYVFTDFTIAQTPTARFRPLAINPNRIPEVKLLPPQNVIPQLNYYVEALYGNQGLWETDSGESPITTNNTPPFPVGVSSANWDQIAGERLPGGDTITAVAFFSRPVPNNLSASAAQITPDIFYIGTTQGKVYRTLNDGSDGFITDPANT